MADRTNQIGLRELFLSVISWKNFLLNKWKIILIAGIAGGVIGIVYATLKKKTYISELSFALEERKGGLSAYSGIASQLGLDIGGGEGGAFMGDNIMDLLTSRRIIESALLTEVKIDGKKDLLVNRYIHFNELDEAWSKKETMKGFAFKAGQPREEFTQQQDSVLDIFYRGLRETLVTNKVDKKSAIITVKFIAEDELFAKLFVEVLVKNVSEFYIDSKTRKMKANLFTLQNRVDSVHHALEEEMMDAAMNQDINQNPGLARTRIPAVKRQMNVTLLTTLYGELVKNLEVSKLTLMREEPLIQVIDKPILPLKIQKSSRLISMIVGGFIAGFLVVFFMTTRKIYNRVMQES